MTHFLMSMYGLYEEMRDDSWYVLKVNRGRRPPSRYRTAPLPGHFANVQGGQGLLVEG